MRDLQVGDKVQFIGNHPDASAIVPGATASNGDVVMRLVRYPLQGGEVGIIDDYRERENGETRYLVKLVVSGELIYDVAPEHLELMENL